jgi:hypothetical protein
VVGSVEEICRIYSFFKKTCGLFRSYGPKGPKIDAKPPYVLACIPGKPPRSQPRTRTGKTREFLDRPRGRGRPRPLDLGKKPRAKDDDEDD